MNKRLSILLLVSLLILSACGFQRNSNEPANPKTQLNGQDKNIPNTGNEEVNKENDVGIPKTDIINDPTFEKPE